MSRYSPTVLPGSRSGLAEGLQSFLSGFQGSRDRARQQGVDDELLEMRRAEEGRRSAEFDRQQAQQEVSDLKGGIERPEVFQQRLSPLAREIGRLTESMRDPTRAAMPARSRVLDQQRGEISRSQVARAIQDIDGHRTLSNGSVYVPSADQEVQEKRQLAERLRDEIDRLVAAGVDPNLAQVAAGNPTLTREVLPQPDVITIAGRRFPNTPEGERQAHEWDQTVNPGKYREPTGERDVNWPSFVDESGAMWERHPQTGQVRPVNGPDGRQMRQRVAGNAGSGSILDRYAEFAGVPQDTTSEPTPGGRSGEGLVRRTISSMMDRFGGGDEGTVTLPPSRVSVRPGSPQERILQLKDAGLSEDEAIEAAKREGIVY